MAAREQAQPQHTRRQIERAHEAPPPSDAAPTYGGHSFAEGTAEGTSGFVQRISHLVLGVTDLDRSEHWYNDFMGMDIVGRALMADARPHSGGDRPL